MDGIEVLHDWLQLGKHWLIAKFQLNGGRGSTSAGGRGEVKISFDYTK